MAQSRGRHAAPERGDSRHGRRGGTVAGPTIQAPRPLVDIDRIEGKRPATRVIRTLVGLVVLAALVAGCVYGFRALWSAANANSSSGDSTLSQAISTEKVTPLSDASVSPSTHSFTNYLVLVVDSVDAKPPTLKRAVVVVDDTTLGTVREAELPVALRVPSGAGDIALKDLVSSSGVASAVSPVSSALSIQLNHVVVVNASALDQFKVLVASNPDDLVSSASNLLSGVRSDLSNADLLASLATIGRPTTVVSVSGDTGSLADGSDATTIDVAQLGLDLGLLVANQGA
jgi:hypothetical protein